MVEAVEAGGDLTMRMTGSFGCWRCAGFTFKESFGCWGGPSFIGKDGLGSVLSCRCGGGGSSDSGEMTVCTREDGGTAITGVGVGLLGVVPMIYLVRSS